MRPDRDVELEDYLEYMERTHARFPAVEAVVTHMRQVADGIALSDENRNDDEIVATLRMGMLMILKLDSELTVQHYPVRRIDALSAVRLALLRRRETWLHSGHIIGSYPHLSFADVRKAAKALSATFPESVKTKGVDYVMLTGEVPADFSFRPAKGVAPPPLLPTPIAPLEDFLIRARAGLENPVLTLARVGHKIRRALDPTPRPKRPRKKRPNVDPTA